MKRYIKPNIIVVNVQSEAILAGSTVGYSDEFITNSSTIGAKEIFYDDEDWDEE